MEKEKLFLQNCIKYGAYGNFTSEVKEAKEALAELEAMNLTRREWYQKGFSEAMKQRTCEGCKYEYSDELEEPCKNCKRNTPDFYAKDNS